MAKFAVVIDPRSLFRLLHDANEACIPHSFVQQGYPVARSGPLKDAEPQHSVTLIWEPNAKGYPETRITLHADGTWATSCVLEGAKS